MITATVGEVAKQIRGVSYKKTDAKKTPGNGMLPILRANNITEDGLIFNDLVYVPTNKISPSQMLQQGDVLVAASSGSLDVVGKAANLKHSFEGGFGAFCKTLRPNPELVDPSYFAHFFYSQKYRRKVKTLAAGANINNLKNEHLDNLTIPLPPLEEQRRIAAILDKADALRQKRKQTIALLDSLTQSIFLEMFGDPFAQTHDANMPEAILSDVTDRITYGFTQPMSHHDSGVPIITAKNVQFGYLDYENVHYANESEFANLTDKSKPEAGDILVTKDGTIGRSAIFAREQPICINQSVCLVKPNKKLIHPKYLLSYILCESVQSRIKAMKKGNSIAHLQITEFANFPIFIPKFAKQLSFAEEIDKKENMRAKFDNALISSEHLFNSLQHRAFSGEL